MAQTSPKELVIIGAGPGGYSTAFAAADMGIKVTLIDPEEHPGGVCLYRGCIPSKTLLHIAKIITDAGEAQQWGLNFDKPKIDLEKIRSWKNSVVNTLAQGTGQLCTKKKVKYIQAVASFIDSNTIEVKTKSNSTEKISFDHALIATGSVPATFPNTPSGSNRVMNSAAALEMQNIPESMLVIGGGYIGLELGTVYAALGTRVSVVEMTDSLMPGVDPELIAILRKRLDTVFDSIMLNTKVTQITEKQNAVTVYLEGTDIGNREETYDSILVAVGRKPNTAGLALENTKVQIDQAGHIIIDSQRRTDDPAIYAVGDVTGGMLLAHKASAEGVVAAQAIAGIETAFEPRAIPFVEFTDPEVAQCGLSEQQAKDENLNIKVARFPWQASGRAQSLGRPDGLTKLVVDADTQRILGMSIVGVGAGDIISEGTLAIEMGAVATDLGLTIHPHPTMSETIMQTAKKI